jgi:lipid A ethanolaminephosphotransferase
MHGLPKKLAPKEQYEIPFLVWTSKDFRTYKSELPAVLEQHYIFHSVLNLLSIQSPAYDQALDIFKPASTPLKNQE